MARPRAKIDQVQFEKLCAMLCTEKEIAAFFGVCEDTLDNWCKRIYGVGFSESYNNVSVRGKISLRRNQFKLSETSATMAIWLGKQYLGQKDISQDSFEDDKEINVTLSIEDVSGGEE